MNGWEKKIVTTAMWSVAAVAGLFVANTVYDKGMVWYMKLFHRDLWGTAVEELS